MALKQDGRIFRAIAWRAAERHDYLAEHRAALDVAFSLEQNQYNGETYVELTLRTSRLGQLADCRLQNCRIAGRNGSSDVHLHSSQSAICNPAIPMMRWQKVTRLGHCDRGRRVRDGRGLRVQAAGAGAGTSRRPHAHRSGAVVEATGGRVERFKSVPRRRPRRVREAADLRRRVDQADRREDHHRDAAAAQLHRHRQGRRRSARTSRRSTLNGDVRLAASDGLTVRDRARDLRRQGRRSSARRDRWSSRADG